MVLRSLALATLLTGVATPAMAAEARQSSFGRRFVPAVTLTNKAGVSATVIAYGASLQSLVMPDRTGKRADVLLGYDSIDDYLRTPQYFGSTVGRFANRIASGRFSLDGGDYRVPINNGRNSLHGGAVGFDKVLWSVVSVKSGPTASEPQLFPDTPNQPAFGSARLAPGQVYRNVMTYRLTTGQVAGGRRR